MPPVATAARARRLLVTMYGLFGVMTASWLARIPTVRDLLHLSTGQVGAFLLVGSVGSLAAVTLSGVVVQRLGNRRTLLAATGVLAVGYTLMGVGPAVGSGLLLAAGILLNGVAVSLANVVFNVESARIEHAMGRTVIPHFHAAFSLGAMAGSALGALASRAGVPLAVQMPAVVAVAIGCRLAALPGALLPPVADEVPAPAAAVAAVPRRRAVALVLDPWRERRTLLIGVVVLAASLSEGSANNWLSLAVVDGFGAPEASGGLVLGLFVGSMTAVRALGTRLIDRFGRVAVLRASGAAALAGLLTFGVAPRLPVAAAGVVLWGFGAALAVPIGIAAASDDPRRAASRVAAVTVFSSIASIAAPPLLGLAAESMGARHALLLVAVAMVASLSVAGQVRRLRPVAPAGGGASPAAGTSPDGRTPSDDGGRIVAATATAATAAAATGALASAAADTLVGNHSR